MLLFVVVVCYYRTEQNIYLFRHSAYIAHSLKTNTAWERKMKNEK